MKLLLLPIVAKWPVNMTDPIKLEESVKWRGSSYDLVKVEGERVFWFNQVSRHYDNCSMMAWANNDPYDHMSH